MVESEGEGEMVWGGLFEVTEECFRELDEREGYSMHYNTRELQVYDDDGNCYIAYVYVRGPQRQGKPSPDYLDTLLQGAKDCGLPCEYVERISRYKSSD